MVQVIQDGLHFNIALPNVIIDDKKAMELVKGRRIVL